MPRRGEAVSVADGLCWLRLAGGFLLLGQPAYNAQARSGFCKILHLPMHAIFLAYVWFPRARKITTPQLRPKFFGVSGREGLLCR